MFYGYIKLRSKTKPTKLILEDWSSSRLNRYRALLLLKRLEISIKSLVVIRRDIVIEPSIKT
jgi:hypothetical protein